mmetsp:Transcript_11990/g.16262  ORF Transcript_11990/g.16262 Transcript_11990/m.16262 type:complete len:249 (+) Transcript_11990:1365-2111(+)
MRLTGLDDIFKLNFGGERVAVVDDGLAILAIPAVQLHTLASRFKGESVHMYRAFGGQLVAREVGVVRGADPVVRQRVVHIVGLMLLFLGVHDGVVDGEQEHAEDELVHLNLRLFPCYVLNERLHLLGGDVLLVLRRLIEFLHLIQVHLHAVHVAVLLHDERDLVVLGELLVHDNELLEVQGSAHLLVILCYLHLQLRLGHGYILLNEKSLDLFLAERAAAIGISLIPSSLQVADDWRLGRITRAESFR